MASGNSFAIDSKGSYFNGVRCARIVTSPSSYVISGSNAVGKGWDRVTLRTRGGGLVPTSESLSSSTVGVLLKTKNQLFR